MRIYTVEQKLTQTSLQANLRSVLSARSDKNSYTYSSKNKVDIDEDIVQSITIGGNFIAYLTTDGQAFAVYYNVKVTESKRTLGPLDLLNREQSSQTGAAAGCARTKKIDYALFKNSKSRTERAEAAENRWMTRRVGTPPQSSLQSLETRRSDTESPISYNSLYSELNRQTEVNEGETQSPQSRRLQLQHYYRLVDRLVDRDYTESPSSERTKKREAPDKEKKGEGVISEPEVSQPIQWLDSKKHALYFKLICSTKSSVLLVCTEGRLWRWDMQDNSFGEHPLYKSYCYEKAITKISASNIRITVLLETGEMAVFYDSFVTGTTGTPPAIISELSHPGEVLPTLEEEVIVDVRSADFLSCVRTESGKVLWWGMLPTKDVSYTKTKSKGSSKSRSIRSGCQVILCKQSCVPVGSLVYTSTPQSKLARVEVSEGNVVKVRVCEKPGTTDPPTSTSSSSAASSAPSAAPASSASELETWLVSEIVVLESAVGPLGTVIGLHGTNAIIMISKNTDPQLFSTELKQYKQMFSEGQFDKLHDDDVDMEQRKEDVMEIDESSLASDTSHTNANTAYPNLCVYPVSELELYHGSGRSCSGSYIQKKPICLLGTTSSTHPGYKALCMSVCSRGYIRALARCVKTGDVYMFSKEGLSHACEAIVSKDSSFLNSSMGSMPQMLTTSDVTLLLDNAQIPFIPLIPTQLNARETKYFRPLNAIAIKQEMSPIPGSSRLMVAVARQSQVVMPHVQQGDLKRLMELQDKQSETSEGAGHKGKRRKVDTKNLPWSSVIKYLETERDSCGRNVLHVCCRSKPYLKSSTSTRTTTKSVLPIRVDDSFFHSISMVKRNESFEELRFSYYSHGRQRELKERDRWLHVLKFITGIEGINLPQLLSETDNAGYTPFLSALAAKTYSHASHMLKVILELEPANPGLLQASVWCALPHGFTAHHLLSHGVPCCTLVIQRLPSWYNETSLYNLFSQNYPTMYKAIIQVRPKTGGSAKYKNLFEDKPTRMERWRSFVSRSASVSPFAMSNNNSQVIQGVVFFSCPLEARRALVQMDGYVIPAKQNTRHNMFGPYGGYYETTVRFAEKDFKGFFATKQKRKRSRTETEFDVTMEKNRRSLQSFLLASQAATAVNNLGETPLAGLINQSFLGKIEEKSNERAATSTTDSVRSRPLTEWGRFPSLRSRSTTSDTEFRAGYEGTQGSQALPIVHPIYSYYMPQRMRPPDTISHPFWSPTIQLSSRRGFGRGRIISPSSQEQSSIGSDWIDVCAAPNPRMFFSSRDGDDALSRLQRVHSLDTLSDRTRDSEEEPATVPSEDDDPWAAPEQPPSSTREEFSEDVSTSFSIENLIRETDGFFHQLEASQRRCGEVVPFQGIQDSTFNMSEVLSNTMLPHLPPVSLSSSHLMSLSPSASLPPLTLRSTDIPPEPTFTPPPPFATPPPTFSTATSNTFNSPVSTGVFSTTTGTFSSAFSTATSTSSSSTNVASPTPSEPPLMFTDYEDELPDMPSVEKQLCTDWNSVVTTLYSCFTGLKQLPDDINFKAGGASEDESTEEVDVKQEQEQGDAKPASAGKEKLSSEGSQGKGKKRRRAEQDETVTVDSGAFDESKIERMLERTAEESCDAEMMPFVHNLVANTTVGLDIADTVVEQINEKNEGALFIGILFSRALAKYLTLQYTNLGPRECLRELPEYKLITTTKELMTKFGWLGVWEIVHASQALLLPLQYNVYKTQAHLSTQDHHIFPHPPGYMLASDFQVSPAISTHPSTYLRQCPRLLTKPTKAPSPNHGGVFLPRLHPEDEDDSAEELSADEGENSDTNNPTLNFFDVVDSFFNPNPPPASSTDQDPFFMWAVDGQPNPHRPVLRRQTSSMDDQLALLRENGNERGKNILACVFSRMAKCATDLASTAHCNKVCTPLKKRSEECLQSWWAWIEPVLISLEAQFNKAAEFDLEKYAVMLKQGEKKFKSMYNPTTLSKSSITASFPQEYVMYLLDSHTSNVCKSLPITDIKSYKHVVYIFDAMYYIVSKWPTVHNGAGESAPSSSTEQPKENYFLKRSPSLDVLTDLAEGGGAVLSGDLERSVEEQLPLALQPHLLTPLVPKEKLFSNQIRQERSSSSWRRKEALRQHEASSLLSQTAAQLLSTWDTTTRIFSKYYLGEGPGIEQSSVLNLRACYSGKIARFVRQTKELRYFVQSRGRQEMRDPFPRMHNLHIYVNRKTVLKDSFRVLLEMTHLQPVNYNVKFEGEEGGGPGVNRGWFSAVCAALRDDTSYPDQAAPLFWCPGRQPEQADIVAPRYWGGDPLLCKERIEGFRACGRYLGLALWFKQTLPFKVCRHVWKFLLKRQLCWADLAFYNADLYEGLRATLNDARWMTEEEFAEVYGYCSFEAQIENTTTEFFPGGSNLSLTKGNAERYVQSYSEHVMVGRVQEELVALRAGFTDILPPHTLSGLTAEDLTLLLSGGTGDIPFERLYNIITFANSIGCSQSKMEQFKRWFWRIIKEMTMAERQHLLYFATGSSTLPPVDHTTEQTRDRINITVDVVHDSRNALPMASTCGQRISIPLYRSRAMLQSKLATALHCKTYGLG